jgi:SHS family lactate transporter-like MFS transporter
VDPSHNHEGQLVPSGGRLPFWTKFRYAITRHWSIFIYCTVLTGCFNTLGHGHLDVYPSFLEQQRGLDAKHETWVTVILQCGGVLGGIVGGYLSRYSTKWVPFGFAVALGPILPAIILPKRWTSLSAAAFFFEFCYGAAIGNVGNILQMVCPHPGIRSAFGGVTYNLGNAISSIAPTIETKLGDDYVVDNGKPNYGKVILTLAGIVSVIRYCFSLYLALVGLLICSNRLLDCWL